MVYGEGLQIIDVPDVIASFSEAILWDCPVTSALRNDYVKQ